MLKDGINYGEHQKDFMGPVIPEEVILDRKIRFILTGVQDKFGLSENEMGSIYKRARRIIGKEANGDSLGSKSVLSAFHYVLGKIIHKEQSLSENIGDKECDEEIIKGIWLDDLENNKNPIVIYDGDRPLYWNLSMEKLTGYEFNEIKNLHTKGENIMKLLYSWSPDEVKKVQSALGTGRSYENATFTLMSKNGDKHMVAWFTRFVEYRGKIYTLRSGSEEISKIIEFLDQSNTAVQVFFNDIMNDKDPSTKGHINRVKIICDYIGVNMGLSIYELKQLGNSAFFHDLGKRYIADDILKKTGKYTPEDRRIMETHTGLGIMEVINSGYESYAEGMVHHCFFYSKNGKPELKYKEMIRKCKAGEDFDLADFNRLMGTNIPKEGRMITIADSIDAIGSRRIYSDYAGESIEYIVDFISKELLRASGLIMEKGVIKLDGKKWQEAGTKEELFLPYCIKFSGTYYIPNPESTIQFDPLMLMKNFKNGDLCEEIKRVILENDRGVIKDKLLEFIEFIEKYEDKKREHKALVKSGAQIEQSKIFTSEDSKELKRLRSVHTSLLRLKEEYGI